MRDAGAHPAAAEHADARGEVAHFVLPLEKLGHPPVLLRRVEQLRLRLEVDSRMLAAIGIA